MGNEITDDAMIGYIGMMLGALVIAVPTTIKFWVDRNTPVFRGASIKILLIMSCGNVFLGIIGGFFVLTTLNDATCTYLKPWFADLVASIQTIFITLKLWRINKIFNNKEITRISVIKDNELIIRYCVIFTCVFLIPKITIIAIGGEMSLIDQICRFDDKRVNLVYSLHIAICHAITLLISCYYAWKTRKTPALINESDHLGKMTIIILGLNFIYQSITGGFRPQPGDEYSIEYALLTYFYWSYIGTLQLAYCVVKLHFKKGKVDVNLDGTDVGRRQAGKTKQSKPTTNEVGSIEVENTEVVSIQVENTEEIDLQQTTTSTV